jgi:hypothetical protein
MASLTRKHFQAIADVLCDTGASNRTIEGFSNYFQTENPRFNRSRFEAAVQKCKRARGLGRARARRRK